MSVSTIVSLVVGILTLLTTYATGLLQAHPDVAVVLTGLWSVLGHYLEALKPAAPAVAPPANGPVL